MQHRLGPARREFLAPEFLLVVLIAFGLFSAASLWSLVAPTADGVVRLFDEHHRWNFALYQMGVAPVIAYILYERRWRWGDFALGVSAPGIVEGLGLAAGAYLALSLALAMVAPLASAAGPLAGAAAIASPSAAALFLPAVVNPIFEELLVCGYVIQSLRGRFGIVTAVNVSIALRMSYHLYQGPAAFLAFALFGLLFTLFYVRTGRLWPLIVAHAALEAFQLAP